MLGYQRHKIKEAKYWTQANKLFLMILNEINKHFVNVITHYGIVIYIYIPHY